MPRMTVRRAVALHVSTSWISVLVSTFLGAALPVVAGAVQSKPPSSAADWSTVAMAGLVAGAIAVFHGAAGLLTAAAASSPAPASSGSSGGGPVAGSGAALGLLLLVSVARALCGCTPQAQSAANNVATELSQAQRDCVDAVTAFDALAALDGAPPSVEKIAADAQAICPLAGVAASAITGVVTAIQSAQAPAIAATRKAGTVRFVRPQ